MPITQADLLEAVRAAVATQGLPVRIGQQDAVAGASPYLTVQVLTDTDYGYPRETITTSTYEVEATREARVQVQGFGSSTWQVLTNLAALLMAGNSTVRTGIVAAGVVPNRTVGPRNATAPYRTGMLPSYALDVVAQYVVSPAAVLGVSPAAGIRGSVADSEGETLDPAFILPEV
jgi:hypothetical protein